MPINYTVLKTELTTNPQNLQDASANTLTALYTAGRDGDCAALLNAAQPGATFLTWRNNIRVGEVVNAIAAADFTGLTALQIQKMQLLFTNPVLDATQATLRANFTSIFAGLTTTLNNLTAVGQRQMSDAERLFGLGTTLTANDIAVARSS